MSQALILNFLEFIAVSDGQLVTDSLKVAAVHKKRHDNIIRLIRSRISEAGEWGLLNFEEGVYFDGRNDQHHPMFKMTQAGYQFLVGRMTGKKAVEHQIAFIQAFNAMAAYVKNQQEGLPYRRMKLELECRDSERRGSFHGKGLNQRKQEKSVLEAELSSLLVLAQPSLLLN